MRLSPIRMIGAAMLAVTIPLSATACGGDGSTPGDKIVIAGTDCSAVRSGSAGAPSKVSFA